MHKNKFFMFCLLVLINQVMPMETMEQKDVLGTPLHQANTAEEVTRLLGEGYSVNDRNCQYSVTPLHKAAERGNIPVINALIENNAHINARDDTGGTPLHEAATHDKADAVNRLLDAKAAITAITFCGETPVHAASFWGKASSLKALLARKPDIKKINKYKSTALHLAAADPSSDDCTLILLEYITENDPEFNIVAKNIRGKTALEEAVEFDCPSAGVMRAYSLGMKRFAGAMRNAE